MELRSDEAGLPSVDVESLGRYVKCVSGRFTASPLTRSRCFVASSFRSSRVSRMKFCVESIETVHATALIEGNHANWPNNVGATSRPAPPALVVNTARSAGDHQLHGGISQRSRVGPIEALLRAGRRSDVGQRGRRSNFPACVMARPAAAMPSSNFTRAPVMIDGWIARANLRCTRSSNAIARSRNTASGSFRFGPETSASRSISGTASERPRNFRRSMSSDRTGKLLVWCYCCNNCSWCLPEAMSISLSGGV